MGRYLRKRVILSVATLMIIILVLFLMLHLMPGSPFNDEKLSQQQLETMRAHYGLDQPLLIQYGRYVINLLRGDFGVSYAISQNTGIGILLKSRVRVSFLLGGMALAGGILVGLFLGIVSAVRKGTWIDTLCTVISVFGVSLPSYVIAILLLYFVGYKASLLPLLYTDADPLRSLLMPALALGMFTLATVSRFTRSEMLEVLDSDYILLAKSKGITGMALIRRHALKNILIPLITVIAPLVVDLMTGSLVIEKIFSIPGIGSLMVQAIQSNDYSVTLALAFLYSALYIGIMLIVDLLYGVIDPRIRLTAIEEQE